jgi:hypothetical protein
MGNPSFWHPHQQLVLLVPTNLGRDNKSIMVFFVVFIYLFFVVLGGLYSGPPAEYSHHQAPTPSFYGFFQDRISRTIYLGWLQTMIPLISASWVARITGMSHWCLALL